MRRRPPRSTLMTHSFPTRRSSDLIDSSFDRTDAFEVTLSGSYLDAQYTRFENAPCFTGQTAAQGCVPNSANQLVQDLTGQPTTRAPEWTDRKSTRLNSSH